MAPRIVPRVFDLHLSRKVGVGVMALAVTALLAGCTDSGLAPSDTGPSSAPEGLATYRLPLDDYIISPFEWDLGNYAENLLAEQCMNSHGYEWSVPRRDVDSLAPPATQSASGRRIFNVDIAKTYGYHQPDWLPENVVKAEQALGSQVLSAEKQTALDSCITEDARTTLPLPQNYEQLGTYLANDALARALESEEVVSAIQQWRTCMAPAGIDDLPESPLGMPGESLAAEWRVGEPDTVASVAEIEMAIDDATCREQSGFDVALYTAESRFQEAALSENADALLAEQREAQSYIERVSETLASLGA